MQRINVITWGPKRKTVRTLLFATFSALLLWGAQVWAQGQPVRIMPLGDSLTSALNGDASYRYWLWHMLTNAGYQVTFVGTQWGVGDGVSGIYPKFNQYHEGHSGDTTADILYGLSGWAAQDQPDIVLLLIGSNDFAQGYSAGHAIVNVSQIIHTLRLQNPNVAILWAEVPPEAGQMPQDAAFNWAVPRLAQKWSTDQSPIEPVNLWSSFSPAQDTVDGIHPNVAGEKLIASRFYAGLLPVLSRFGQ